MRYLFSIGTIICLLGCAHPVRHSVWSPVTNEILARAWVGYDQDGASFYRLALIQDSTGELGIVYQGSTVYNYRIRQWSIKDNQIMIEIDDVAAPFQRISARADAFQPPRILLYLKRGNGWNETVLLRSEHLLKRDMAILNNEHKVDGQ